MGSRMTGNWGDLPVDLWTSIYERLDYSDCISFSRVCKDWHSIHRQLPWLLTFHPSDENQWEFTSFSGKQKRVYAVKIHGEQGFLGINVIATTPGWLLLTDQERTMVCCYNPFSSKNITLPDLPNMKGGDIRAAFSAAPACQDSVIFVISSQRKPGSTIFICTYCRADEYWTEHVFKSQGENCGLCNNVVYYDGNFYCIFECGALGIFNVADKGFDLRNLPLISRTSTTVVLRENIQFHLAESEGEILLIGSEFPVSYCPLLKLDRKMMAWVVQEKLEARALFLNRTATSICSMCSGPYTNKVFSCDNTFPWILSLPNGIHSISSSYPMERGSNFVWIEPPKVNFN